jgi:dynein heavy chain
VIQPRTAINEINFDHHLAQPRRPLHLFSEILEQFFSSKNVKCILIPDNLKIVATMPKMSKTKCLAISKTAEKLTEANIHSCTFVDEISGMSSFENLELISTKVFLPVLFNQMNQMSWGNLTSRDITDCFHSFLSSSVILCGQVKGETRLPTPPSYGDSGSFTDSTNRISLLESSIITWTKQIKNVLKQDPEEQLKLGFHPTPDVEILFWKNKANNLNSIFEQLQNAETRRVLDALDEAKSTYCITFARICKEVYAARLEANDNMKHLKTLEKWVNKLMEDDFVNTSATFKPILHTIMLIWKHSVYYNIPSRLVILIREICNAIIDQACHFISGEQIFTYIKNEEANVVVDQLLLVLKVCGNFKNTYFEYKTKVANECPQNPWSIQNGALFARLDCFIERSHDILDLTKTIIQFSKLAKVEIGGTKGSTLTSTMQEIKDAFQISVDAVKNLEYDIMDIKAVQFDNEYSKFRKFVKEIERRLAAVIGLALDDCETVYGRFKLVEIFDKQLLDRPIIQDEVEVKQIVLIQSYGKDLKAIQEEFLKYRCSPPKETFRTLPPISGALTWCHGLIARAEIPMEKMQELDRNILDREEAKEVIKVQRAIMSSFIDFERQKVKEWGHDVETITGAKLELNLLRRKEESRKLVTNFDPALVRLLREVKYFLLLGLSVPDSALKIFRSADIFRARTGNLDLIVNMNNSVLDSLLPVEKPLIDPYLAIFDETIQPGLEKLNWQSDGVAKFIDDSMAQVKKIHGILKTMKDNLGAMQDIVNKWDRPMFERKTKPMEKEEFERTFKSMQASHFSKIKDDGDQIHALLNETNNVLGVSKGSAEWKCYVEFVKSVVVSGLSSAIMTSLRFLLDQINPESIRRDGRLPLFEIMLVVHGANGINFQPPLSHDASRVGMTDMIDNVIGSFFQIATLFNRLDAEGTYEGEMHLDSAINSLLASVSDTIVTNDKKCHDLRMNFDKYSYLWETDLTSYFKDFCDNATIITKHGTRLLDLDKFDKAIQKCVEAQTDVAKVQSSSDIGWLRIDIAPAKRDVSQFATKWINLFTSHMRGSIVATLSDLHKFMESVNQGLSRQVDESHGRQSDELMTVMSVIRDVRLKTDSVPELFGPQRDCIQILRRYGVDVSNDTIAGRTVQNFLEEAPLAWEAVVKKTFKKKENIMPMQMASLDALKLDLDQFYLSIRKFRGDFRAQAPFKFEGSCSTAFDVIDSFTSKLDQLEIQIEKFRELEDLFELQPMTYPEIGESRSEIKQLTLLWKFKEVVSSVHEGWGRELWCTVDAVDLEDQNKRLRKQLKEMGSANPAMKGWQVYRDIDDSMAVMATVLPLVNDLHADAIRERHWTALARVCNAKAIVPSDPKFTLCDMLMLKLDSRKQEIEDIIETAMKELKIEKKLTEIEGVWSVMELNYSAHKETDIFLPRPSEEVVESMEAHQMELQGIYGMGQFMEYFKDRVVQWQSRLRTVDDTLSMWLVVSRSWASLESIFLASADIRSQLPEDTKRFEGIDSEFKQLMKKAVLEVNCIKVCSVEGRYESLKGMRERLEMCQKSLNQYLDIKKKIFPRFYFVSSVALLDILANGTNPRKILPYLGDCYDSLANLEFVTLDDGKKSDKTVCKMIAKDGEEAPLYEHFTMEGEVESYLNRLTDSMRKSLKVILSDAVEKAVNWDIDTPRHEWLFNYPAQLCITGTQIYWTEETQLALEEYEGGQEDAVKRYLQVCNNRLSALIQLVLGDLSAADRTKIISIITMDVHSRDVVDGLIAQKTEGPNAFAWQKQMRLEWEQPTLDVNVKICDFSCKYFYEWVGNSGRLVITPLTDRCYITLTMALKLYLGGAPAGPAGTGKTETTKDLARALAVPCYVFNCSNQMNFQSIGDIFRGLAQTGAWGCFDEFNRIPIEVLSVVATQVKTIQDAIVKLSRPENREDRFKSAPAGTPPTMVGYFDFMGDTISLIPTCGFFITMNPGYAGRTELPENLKALFRSCAMIRPDFKLIQENMLMAEGFQTARALSVKFNTLYELSLALLSKQPHYDWGLRAVKSVLRVAGGMKRANPTMSEDQVLLRALRDFNTPKMPTQDIPIFLRLVNDLFPGLTVESKADEGLKAKIVRVAKERGLQYDEVFVNKTCNFQELLNVRHSVMLLGPAGCAKTTIWKTLQGAHNLDKRKNTCVAETVNPKAVTGDELYGYMTLAKDWKDGVLSIIMRGMSKNFADQGFHDFQTCKWVVLDGDIDAVWIESMNTVMDDNKVLTLVSNERVPLSPAMRMVFEISSLKNATPATVSRAGILFINETDVGWRPLVETWVHGRENSTEKNNLPSLFDRYVDALVDMTRRGYKEVTSLRLINKVSTIIYLLEGLLPLVPDGRMTPETIEMLFAFSAMWAFGGPMIIDKTGDYRKKFSEDFAAKFGVKFPKDGLCFDYFYDPKLGEHVHWQSIVPKYSPVPIGTRPGETPFCELFVETVETVRITYLLDKLVRNGKYAMLVGNAGTGKTEIIKNYLDSLDKEKDGILSKNIVMSYYTTSFTLQNELEGYIDKRSRNTFGPPMGKKMVFFIDDMNLPFVETYGTQNSIALLTQHMQYGSIFDRTDLGMRKQLMDIQYVAAMNPTSGSFEICERCQRHFATFAIAMPSQTDLNTIFSSLFGGHMSTLQPVMQELTSKIVDTAIRVHEAVSTKFVPSAVRFMYNWNMRELTNIFQGCCLAKGDYYINPVMLARLYAHESHRVYADRLVTEDEVEIFHGIFDDIVKSGLVGPSVTAEDLFAPNNVFTNFVTTSDGSYLPVPSMEKLKSVMDAKLVEYNDNNAIMDLVLFKQAILHIARVNRVIQNPGGNAMLVGVGGSGKQSLCRLAAFISGFEVRQISVTSNYGVEDLKELLRSIYISTGVRGKQTVFLMTDAQIVNEKFLVYINGMITSGWIPDLFPKEDLENIFGSIANEAKAVGIPDNPEARTNYFVSKVKKNLHVVLAFSPVGDTFRIRARRFPGLVNNTVIDQFHPWPRDALVSVAERFLQDVDMSGSLDIRTNLAMHMAEEHLSVANMSRHYLETQRRYNYVTPKSYLELISFFKYLLGNKQADLQRLIDRLDVGLSTLRKTSQDVAELQKDLKITMEKVAEKKVMTDKLIKEMSIQQADAQVQEEGAQLEAKKANEESQKAMIIETEAEKELSAAKPAMEAAAAAVDCLSKAMLSELKNLGKPPAGVDKVTNTCLILIEKEYSEKKFTWNRAKAMMQNVDAFKAKLSEFKGEDITEEEIALLKPYIEDADFTPEKMSSKSAAAANLCTWVVNIYNFNRIYVNVKPLMDSLQAARESKAAAINSLEVARKKVAEVQQQLAILNEKYTEAVREKKEVEDQAAVLTTRADLAQRLVGGLASENVRWGKEIERLKCNATTLVGDCMLAAGFVSYVGAFDKDLREQLWKMQWSADLKNRGIPMTEGSDPLEILSDEGKKAKMVSEGLPSDRVSLENGAVLTNCKRWPLLIDPQAQAIKWLMKKEEGNLDVIQLTQKNWLKVLVNAITNGRCVIIENIGTEIDPLLDPVLSRSIYKKGRGLYLKLGGEEVEYDPGFQLYLQTKLNNPHYKPEISAQCTLINFIATERGLEDQLLAKVVELERPDLEEKARALTAAAVNYQIQLVQLEDDLLERLANAPEDILSDVPLIEGLEATKKTAHEISNAVESGKITQKEVEQAREAYRPQASEGAMLYFLLTKLCVIDHMYQYSLDSFLYFFKKSVCKAPAKDDLQERVLSLRDSLRITVFTWVSRGLFERHKLIFLAQLTFNLIKRGIIGSDWNEGQFQFLIRAPTTPKPNPLDWLPDSAWTATAALADVEEFGKFTNDLVEAAPRFREWFNSLAPEDEKLPLDWAGLDRQPFQKMLVVRCLRPDRMTSALTSFIRNTLPDGSAYIECDSRLSNLQILDSCLAESTPKTPIYFILSPGANVVADLDKKAAEYGLQKGVSYHNVSMGQGQDVVAMSCLETAHRNGHWVILNNVHLMPKWLIELEKKLDEYALEGSHEKFRVFLTSDPSNTVPIGILNRCIKLTSEPPAGLKANLKRAWGFFAKDYIDEADSKTKSILFGLCHFHSILMERKQFGPMGYNMKYPFSIGDLRDSAKCLQNYMDNIGGGKIPWEDLKYIFGEIMYGGHIVNDFDRLLANEYLNFYMKDELLDEMELYPFADDEKGVSFLSPAPTSFEKYILHIDKNLTSDTPIAFGLHSNAEIDFRTQQSNTMFSTLLDLQPKGALSGEGVASPQQVAAATANELLEKFEEKSFDVEDLIKNLDEIGPYQNVFIQEMDVMNVLLAEIRRSIHELQLGFAGELTMSEAMEELMMALYMDRVPASWAKRAWPSKLSLGLWVKNFSDRLYQLEEWMNNPSEIPKVTWISGLVNPTSFLTAICQVAAQKNQWELDKLVTFTRVTKMMTPDEIDGISRDGAYITGLSLQGASIDIASGQIQRSRPKEIFCKMPIIHVKAVTRDKANIGGIYSCPVYMTEQRGPTWYFNAQLRTSSPPARWTLAGVALIGETSG